MFDWLKPKKDCAKSPEIEELQRKLRISEENFAKLSAELEQGYIKDRLEGEYGTQLGYIEKLGESSVKYYEFEYEYRQWLPNCYKRNMVYQWNAKYCIELRDFLVKNFPVKTLKGSEAVEFHESKASDESKHPVQKLNFDDVKAIDENARRKYLAFSDKYTDYYELTQDVGSMPKGTIFYHDTDDTVRGSIAAGCLKLAWTSKGNCQKGCACADTVVFHALFKDEPLFRLVKAKEVSNV